MDLLGALSSEQAGPEEPQCSRKSCRAAAEWQIRWNNPKIHQPERRKIWLACDEHREWLEGFLRQRLFWRSTDPIGTDPPQADEQNRAGE